MKKSYRVMKKTVLLLIILCMSFTSVPAFAETADTASGNNDTLSEQCAKAIEGMVSGILFEDIHKSFAAPNLTDERKAKLYEQYKIKLSEIAMDHNMNFELLPMEEFGERDWVTPEKFKEHLEYMTNLSFKAEEDDEVMEFYESKLWTGKVGKKIKLTDPDGNIAAVICVTGQADTQLDEEKGRQLFSKFNSVTHFMESGMGSWEPLGYERCYADGFRTCMVVIGGTYKSRGVSMQRTPRINFYCRPTGEIV